MNVSENTLLSREKFKELAFKRDNYTCVFCPNEAVDAHHIYDRKLFSDGGYYLGNVASVCSDCHWLCEKTIITVDDVIVKADIKHVVRPSCLDDHKVYDKWGNEMLEDGFRRKGILFDDDGVQKIFKMQNMLWLFIESP